MRRARTALAAAAAAVAVLLAAALLTPDRFKIQGFTDPASHSARAAAEIARDPAVGRVEAALPPGPGRYTHCWRRLAYVSTPPGRCSPDHPNGKRV